MFGYHDGLAAVSPGCSMGNVLSTMCYVLCAAVMAEGQCLAGPTLRVIVCSGIGANTLSGHQWCNHKLVPPLVHQVFDSLVPAMTVWLIGGPACPMRALLG